jgi:hypothetical protein
MDCPDGSVRGTLKDGTEQAGCVAPGDESYPCDLWEYARYGYCEVCPKGEVGHLADYKSCTDCPDGSVRGTLKDGTELADCVAPGDESYPCDLWEYARYGYCEVCPKGEVGYLAYKSCTDCPDGSVHGTLKDGTELADCVAPGDESYPCDLWEYARYGYWEGVPRERLATLLTTRVARTALMGLFVAP